MKTLLFLAWLLLFPLFISCRTKDTKKIEDFSTGLANRDEKILQGIKYIEEQNIKEGKRFFEEFGKQNPNHCGYLIGLPLVNIQDYLDKISSIINLFVNVYSRSGVPSLSSHLHTTFSEYCDSSVDFVVRDFVSNLHKIASEGVELISRAIEQKCQMDVNYPIRLSVGPNFVISLVLRGRIGDVELSFLKYFGNFVLIIADIILAHDFSVNTPAILSNITKLDTSEVVGLIRSLAFLFQGCRSTLSFHPEGKIFLEEIPQRITETIRGTFHFLKSLENRDKQEGYMIVFQDNSGDGMLGYDPSRTTIDTPQDQIIIHIGGFVQVADIRANLKELKVKIPYIITTDFLDDFRKLVERTADIIENKKKGCPENCLSISDLNFFLRSFGTYIDDFLRFDIVNFMEQPKPFRELLPYWFYNQETSRWEFIIEAEVPKSRKDLKPYLFNYDAGHFFYPDFITFYEQILTNYSISPDCISVSDASVNWILIPYLLFQDPTISNSVYVRLKGVFLERCNPIESEYESDIWKEPNEYMINKSVAIVVKKTGSVVSPLTDLILKSIEIVP
ncbi:MAG: hypothetical protein RMJ45_02440 [Candidatus Calescibacterium sp.]|nr:hypothetical protein [Candidatus Calescibacterium sp.]